jgi:hypothetical protein
MKAPGTCTESEGIRCQSVKIQGEFIDFLPLVGKA